VAIEAFQTLGGLGFVTNRNPKDSGLLMPSFNRVSDYDNDNDNDCIRCLTDS